MIQLVFFLCSEVFLGCHSIFFSSVDKCCVFGDVRDTNNKLVFLSQDTYCRVLVRLIHLSNTGLYLEVLLCFLIDGTLGNRLLVWDVLFTLNIIVWTEFVGVAEFFRKFESLVQLTDLKPWNR